MKILTAVFVFIGTISFAQEAAYIIYTSSGKKTTYKKMVRELAEKDIILFGELHDNPIAHWLELELTKSLDAKGDLTLGAEMFEADNQQAVNDYLAGATDAKGLDSTARLWSNHRTDYAPLLDYARDRNLSFVATNIPRSYAAMVNKNGGFSALDSLSEEEKSWMAPLPIEFDATLPQYKKILDMLGDHATPDLVKAQAMKDATMAHFILANYSSGRFLHFNGAFHSNYYEGILWYLQQERPELKYGTISTVSQSNINSLDRENKGIADYVIVVDEDMTSTY
ncbi:MAG: ChaN family lipoprotein [bacterium]|nr:ChaN family lipoprotein [bacterium]